MELLKKLVLIIYSILNTSTPVHAWQDPSGDTPARIQDLEDVFGRILSLVIPGAGIAVFLMLISAGFKYLTSGGDPKKTSEAQQTMTYALIGLLLLLSAYIIIAFIKSFTGVDVTTFTIPRP